MSSVKYTKFLTTLLKRSIFSAKIKNKSFNPYATKVGLFRPTFRSFNLFIPFFKISKKAKN